MTRIFVLIPLVFLPVFAAPQASKSKTRTGDQELQMREYMLEISRQLGVTCNYCHDVKNFRNESMKTWKISKEHMHIVQLLNTRGFTKGPKADCYMCHRGKATPDYKEGLPPTSPLSPTSPTAEPPKQTH